jgi:hypothetical protein
MAGGWMYPYFHAVIICERLFALTNNSLAQG